MHTKQLPLESFCSPAALKLKFVWLMKEVHAEKDWRPSCTFIHDIHHVKFISGCLANTYPSVMKAKGQAITAIMTCTVSMSCYVTETTSDI